MRRRSVAACFCQQSHGQRGELLAAHDCSDSLGRAFIRLLGRFCFGFIFGAVCEITQNWNVPARALVIHAANSDGAASFAICPEGGGSGLGWEGGGLGFSCALVRRRQQTGKNSDHLDDCGRLDARRSRSEISAARCSSAGPFFASASRIAAVSSFFKKTMILTIGGVVHFP